jgi:predicted phosphodiesterase
MTEDKLVAIISDIHGNSWALEKVLEDIESRGIKKRKR